MTVVSQREIASSRSGKGTGNLLKQELHTPEGPVPVRSSAFRRIGRRNGKGEPAEAGTPYAG